MKLEPPPMMAEIANTVEERIRVSFQLLMKPMTNAVKKVANALMVSPTFSEMPSWTRLVSLEGN
jgi:hypothetical protein